MDTLLASPLFLRSHLPLNIYLTAEHSPVEDVADRPVGRPPHLFEPKLGDASLIRRDGRALDSDSTRERGFRGLHGHRIVRRVPVGDGQVVVLDGDVDVR